MPEKKENSKQLVEEIVNAIQEKKGKNILALNMQDIENSITDYFVICHGTSNRQVDAISDSIEELLRINADEKPIRIEGRQQSQWILMDYFNVVVHIFYEETREFYNLEGLWADADIQRFETIE